MSVINGLNHIGVFVSDIEKSKEFYTSVLDFTVAHENTITEADGIVKLVFIKNGGCVIELVQFPKPQKRGDGVVDHIAFDVKNIEETAEKLRARGIAFEGGITHAPHLWGKGSKWILFRGPDNEHLELNELL